MKYQEQPFATGNRMRILWILLGMFVSQAVSAQHSNHNLTEPSRPLWMVQDSTLRVSISLDIKSAPLGTLFAALRQKTGVDLRVERGLEEYRVALHITHLPLYKVMGRLQDLFGHGTLPNTGYVWLRSEEGKGAAPLYLFARLKHALDEEEAQLNAPRKTAIEWTKQIRDYARLSPDKRKAFKSECRMLQVLSKEGRALDGNLMPIGEAVAILTDEQIAVLFETGRVALPRLTFSDAAASVLREAIPDSSDVAGVQSVDLPSEPELVLDENPRSDVAGLFTIELRFNKGFPSQAPTAFGLDTLGQLLGDDDDLPVENRNDQDETIDLLAHEHAPSGKVPKMSMATALELLSRESRMTIYAEVFPKQKRALATTKGTPVALLRSICKLFGYTFRKVNGDYLIYSRSWAEDRAGNVPQALLDHWIADCANQQKVSLVDLLEMVALTDRQLRTLTNVLGITGPFMPRNRDALRLLAVLPSRELETAFSQNGSTLPIENADPQLIRRVFGRTQIIPPVTVRLSIDKNLQDKRIGIGMEFMDQLGIAAHSGIAAESIAP